MNKILKASAGTGKTYRLSLEYINAVLNGTDFRNIVVMTFTRKATAEIRERIIEHLKDLKEKGKFEKNKVCISCSSCSEIMKTGNKTGCAVRDSKIYGPILKKVKEEGK